MDVRLIDLSSIRIRHKKAAASNGIFGLLGLGAAIVFFVHYEIDAGFIILGVLFLIWIREDHGFSFRCDARDLVDTKENRRHREEAGCNRFDYHASEKGLVLSTSASAITFASALAAFGFGFTPMYHLGAAMGRRVKHRADRHAIVSANELSQEDPRPVVLYLRSFDDDEVLKDKGGLWSIEKIVVEKGSLLGPVVAIGCPKEALPPRGIARDYVSDETWQEHVVRWMEEASVIFFVVGGTEGLAWEAARTSKLGFLRKCIWIIPPGEGEILRRRGDSLLSYLKTSAPELHRRLAGVDPERASAIVFDPELEPIVLSSGKQDASAYDVALAYAMGIIVNGGSDLASPGKRAVWIRKARAFLNDLARLAVILGIARLAVFGIWEYKWKKQVAEACLQTPAETVEAQDFPKLEAELRRWWRDSRLEALKSGGQTVELKVQSGSPVSHATPFVAGYADGFLRRLDYKRGKPVLNYSKYEREAVLKSKELADSRHKDAALDANSYRRGYIQGAIGVSEIEVGGTGN